MGIGTEAACQGTLGDLGLGSMGIARIVALELPHEDTQGFGSANGGVSWAVARWLSLLQFPFSQLNRSHPAPSFY